MTTTIFKSVLIKIAFGCILLAIVFEGCQSCNNAKVAPSPSSTPDKGGIPNVGNTCYMNAVLQIIAKFYPDVFKNKDSALAKAGQVIVDKIRDDKDYVTAEEANAFNEALLEIDGSPFRRGKEESSDECIEMIWRHLKLPMANEELGLFFFALNFGNPPYKKACCMSDLLPTCESLIKNERTTLNGVIPIMLARFDYQNQEPIKIDTIVKNVLETPVTRSPLSRNIDGYLYLTGFIQHIGNSSHTGHYVAFINRGGQWRLYDDDEVMKVSPHQAQYAAEKAYLYFYTIKNP